MPLTGAAPTPDLLRDRGRSDELDWSRIRQLRVKAAAALTDRLGRDRDAGRPALDEAGRRELARAVIVQVLTDDTDARLSVGEAIHDADQHDAMVRAVFDALYGMGRLQRLLDDPAIENIEIAGCDRVHIIYAGGRVAAGPPVADSDEELIEDLAFLATRSSSGGRTFTEANPRLDLRLPDGSRLAARAWITPRPVVTIRRHRLVDIDLARLESLQMIDGALRAFLDAAVRARKSIVVAGDQGAGKTTLVRALAAAIDPLNERIGTIETEYELALHEMPHRHARVVALEARPGGPERGPDGRPIGRITLDDHVYDSLRMNLERIIVGEVRGPEVLAMFKAMQAGAGSLSTLHAHSARAAVERLVTCALEAGPHVTDAFAYRQVAENVHLIVHVARVRDHTGQVHRFVDEVIEVTPGEGQRPATTDVFGRGPDGRAVPRTLPSFIDDLTDVGFDRAWFEQRSGTWLAPITPPPPTGPAGDGASHPHNQHGARNQHGVIELSRRQAAPAAAGHGGHS
jgi:Flp pilus assembly CpaF family ATPase